ncbi:hypothetical protein ACNHUS_19075 [Actinomycetes bacterium M1A6_2h]
MKLFDELDDYTSFYVDDCSHLPWTNRDFEDAVVLFGNFVVAERISPTQADLVAELVSSLGPSGEFAGSPIAPQVPSPIGPSTLTSHLKQVALRCESNGNVANCCSAHPATSSDIRRELRPAASEGRDVVEEVLSQFTYRVVIASAIGTDMLIGSGHSLTGGPDFASWLGSPTQSQLHRMLVAAYSECFEPVVDLEDATIELEVAASAAGLWLVLVRSVVGDPFHQGDWVSTGSDTDATKVSVWMTVRVAIMMQLGLVVSVNGMFCVPDTHAPALLEALDRARTRRAGVAA